MHIPLAMLKMKVPKLALCASDNYILHKQVDQSAPTRESSNITVEKQMQYLIVWMQYCPKIW